MARLKTVSAGVSDINGPPPAPEDYLFLGVSGTVNLRGFFVDLNGIQTGDSFTYAVPIGDGSHDPVDLATAYGDDLPLDAYGVNLASDGDLYFSTGAGSASSIADFKANFANYTKLPENDNRFGLGRVG